MLEYVVWIDEEEKVRKVLLEVYMKKVCVIGHFGFGKEMLNGQTIKTKIVAAELEKQLGCEQIMKIDTHGGARVLPKVMIQMARAFRSCENIIILPAQNGVRIFPPLCVVFRKLYQRKLHYIVIGGWLDHFLERNPRFLKALDSFTAIYVETRTMMQDLEKRGLRNLCILPNFKDIHILAEDELVYPTGEPYRLCTFSRVMKEKGIEDAVDAVKAVNEKYGRTVYTLDIYGQIDAEQTKWFEGLKATFPGYVRYKGLVPFDKTVEILKIYYALLFPTYYSGEGFAGTLLDAMSAGVPVIASDWKYNSEVVVQNETGILVTPKNVTALTWALESTLSGNLNEMKRTCINEAQKYAPNAVVQVILERL